MKLISQFNNKESNITYKTYELENGIKLLHLDNPATVDFDFAIVFKAGSYFELGENVPRGTAHFLEHMLLNPNTIFKSKEEIDRFEQGDKTKPSIYTNAFTSTKHIYLTCHSNEKGYERALTRLESELHFPKRKFGNQVEKERGIILAEKSRREKREKNAYLMQLEFLFKDTLIEASYDVLGEKEDIQSITIDHLESFFKNRFVRENCVFSIQSNGELNKKVQNKLENISQILPSGNVNINTDIQLKNLYRVGTFENDKANGVTVELVYFNKLDKAYDYKKAVLEYIYTRLLSWLTFDILREKMSLIYDFNSYKNNYLAFGYTLKSFYFVTENEKIQKTLDELYTLMYSTSFKFLKSKKGKEWFDDVISVYIFPRTSKFDEELGENVVTNLLDGIELFNSNKAVQEAKKITISDLEIFLKKKLNIPPHIWIESDLKDEEMRAIINKSPFSKKFKSV